MDLDQSYSCCKEYCNRIQNWLLKSICDWLTITQSVSDWPRPPSDKHQFEILPEPKHNMKWAKWIVRYGPYDMGHIIWDFSSKIMTQTKKQTYWDVTSNIYLYITILCFFSESIKDTFSSISEDFKRFSSNFSDRTVPFHVAILRNSTNASSVLSRLCNQRPDSGMINQ